VKITTNDKRPDMFEVDNDICEACLFFTIARSLVPETPCSQKLRLRAASVPADQILIAAKEATRLSAEP